MADYFEELGARPLGDGETPDYFLQMARLLRDFGMFEELGEGQRLAPPASAAVVKALPDTCPPYPSQCPVCLKDFEKQETGKEMPCNHVFHPDCIMPWLAKTNSCPLCRYQLPTDDEQYEEYRKAKKREVDREKDIANLHNSMFS